MVCTSDIFLLSLPLLMGITGFFAYKIQETSRKVESIAN